MRIVYYTEKEGDIISPWPTGTPDQISESLLEHKRVNRPKCGNWIWIENVQVHMLAFADGRVWDVVNGWRSTVQDWRKEWDLDGRPFNSDFKIDPGSGTPDWRSTREPPPRPCTCHPDDNPPHPCPRRYALEECRAAANAKAGQKAVDDWEAACDKAIADHLSIDSKAFADEYLNSPGDIVKVNPNRPAGKPLRALAEPKHCPTCNSIMHIWNSDYAYHCTNCGYVE